MSRIAAEEAWESEVAPASEVAPESEAAPEPAESEAAPALPESEMAPEPEERPSMLSRLASWRAPEPEPEMERAGETEAPTPPPGDEPRQLHCDHFHVHAPPGRLGLAFKGSTRVVARVNEMSALPGTAMSIVWQGDELVSVNDCVVADDVLGVLAAQDDGTTDRTLAFARASGRRPEDYYACYAPPGDLCIAFESDARRLVGALSKGNGYEPERGASRPDVGAARRVAEGGALVTVNEVPVAGATSGPGSPSRSPAARPSRGAGSFSRARGFDDAQVELAQMLPSMLFRWRKLHLLSQCERRLERKTTPGGYKQQSIIYYDVSWISGGTTSDVRKPLGAKSSPTSSFTTVSRSPPPAPRRRRPRIFLSASPRPLPVSPQSPISS